MLRLDIENEMIEDSIANIQTLRYQLGLKEYSVKEIVIHAVYSEFLQLEGARQSINLTGKQQ